MKTLEWLKKYKGRLILAAIIVAVLVVAFFMGDDANKNNTISSSGNINIFEQEKSDKNNTDISSHDKDLQKEQNEVLNKEQDKEKEEQSEEKEEQQFQQNNVQDDQQTKKNDEENNVQYNQQLEQDSDKNDIQAGQDSNKNNTVIENNGLNKETQTSLNNNNNDCKSNDAEQQKQTDVSGSVQQNITSDKLYCTFSISCATILDNMDKLDKDKKSLVPKDGWILAPVSVEFTEGESVFDVLKRVCMDRKIHMESSWTPMYNSAYIEGINNIYEFDCGSLSGWMYSVNGEFNNYGASKTEVKNGDVIEWTYTCDLGKDVQK